MTWINKKSDDIFFIVNGELNESNLSELGLSDITITYNQKISAELEDTTYFSNNYNYLIDKKIKFTDSTLQNQQWIVKINNNFCDTSNIKFPTDYTPLFRKNNFIHLKKEIQSSYSIVKNLVLTSPVQKLSEVNIIIRTK